METEVTLACVSKFVGKIGHQTIRMVVGDVTSGCLGDTLTRTVVWRYARNDLTCRRH
jgi:hypothetical protein